MVEPRTSSVEQPSSAGLVGLIESLRGSIRPGVLGAIHPEWTSEGEATTTPPGSVDELADAVAVDVRRHERVTVMAKRYRSDLVRLGLMRPETDTDAGILRAFQRFLRVHVYGKRVPIEELSAAVQKGMKGGRPRSPRRRSVG